MTLRASSPRRVRDHGRVELVRLALARGDDRFELRAERRRRRPVDEPEAAGSSARPAGWRGGSGRASLRPRVARERELFPAVDDRLVERVLPAGVGLAVAEQAADVRLVVGEEQAGARPRRRSGSPATAPDAPGARPARRPAPPSGPGAASAPRGSQVQVFRNQSVGSTWSGAGSGPRLSTVTRIRTSFGLAFAYSTRTSKYRSSSKTPVSRSSNSGSSRPRRAFSSTRRRYGYSRCGYL